MKKLMFLEHREVTTLLEDVAQHRTKTATASNRAAEKVMMTCMVPPPEDEQHRFMRGILEVVEPRHGSVR